jgi:hypothetical protein
MWDSGAVPLEMVHREFRTGYRCWRTSRKEAALAAKARWTSIAGRCRSVGLEGKGGTGAGRPRRATRARPPRWPSPPSVRALRWAPRERP